MLHHYNIRSLSFIVFALSFYTQYAHSLGVEITNPPGGATLSVEQEIVFRWQDGGGNPDITALSTYTLELIVGGNSPGNSQVLQTIEEAGDVKDGSVSKSIDANVAQSIQNGFYLKMTSNTTTGNQVINYSNRFTLVDLTGNTAAQYLQAATAAAGSSANVPAAQYNVLSSPTTSSPSSPSATATATITTPPSNAAPSSPNPPASGLSAGIIAGIVTVAVLAVVGIISIIVWALFLYRRVRRRKQDQSVSSSRGSEELGAPRSAFVDDKAELSGRPVSTSRSPRELDASSVRAEVMGTQMPVEIAEREGSIYELEASGTIHELATRTSKAYDPISQV
ncbi:Hypothetical predicted protein [Lecanosticta acicola]|uniref:Yeast cell wall synthesis Kre9/Knh1-like N-terminal domain-containing protein n=1 Tax=Lecanosticta acicola TaxID=111012 RepID=A0AAI8VVJ2_9PEZI|nr:Hypothetical predicted protein [Lecanosticta acicola]